MKNSIRKLQIDQLSQKLMKFSTLKGVNPPPRGWIHLIRTTLNMSLAQLAKRLGKTPVTVREIEEREADKSITLKKLIEVGEALGLDFVYGFFPKEASLEKIIEQRAHQIAEEIVKRTSHSMKLEEQENTPERLAQAIKDRTDEIKREVPKYLWD